MKFTNPLSPLRPKNSIPPERNSFSAAVSKKMDRRLIQQTHIRRLPTLKQLKYVGRFLSSAEKKVLRLLTALMIISLGAAAAFFITKHVEALPASGGEYTEGFVGQPKYLNPLFSSTNEVDSDIVALIYSRLFTYNEKRELIPDLAEKYTVSDDGKTYDVTLKEGVRWSDGEPLTTQDVVFTFESLQNPEVGSSLAAAFQGVKISKVDEHTIRFVLKQAFAPFIHALVVGVIPEHIWGTIDNPAHMRLAKTNLEPIGSGPWQFAKLIKRDGGGIEALSLVPNKNYYGRAPMIHMVTFRFFPDQGSLLEALKAHKILGVSFPPRLVSSTTPIKDATPYPVELPQYTALFFNLDLNPLLKDKTVRTALSGAINKQAIIQDVLGNAAKTINGPLLPGMIGYDPAFTGSTTTIDEANRLLDKNWQRIQPEEYFSLRSAALKKERGTTDPRTHQVSTTPEIDTAIAADVQKEMSPSQTFYRRDKKDQVLALTITTVDTPEYQKVAEQIAKDWQDIGVQTTIKPINRQFFLRNVIKNRDYDTVLYGEIAGGDPDPFPFWHSSQVNYPGLNLSLYTNRTIDTMLEDARTTLDPAARAKLYRTFEDTLATDVPAVFLYTPLYTLQISTDVKNVSIPPLVLPSDRYRQFATWYIKTTWVWKP